MQKKNDGSSMHIGTTSSFGTNGDIYLLNLKSSGDTVWTRCYGGAGQDNAYNIIATADGGFLINGTSNSFNTINQLDAYIIKTDSIGNVVWSKTYGGNKGLGGPASLFKTSMGNYILSGSTYSFGAGIDSLNAYAICINPLGDTLWTKVYGYYNTSSFTSGLETNDSNLLFVGITETNTAQNFIGFSLKINPANGSILWAKTNEINGGQYISLAADGGAILGGNIFNGTNNSACIIKTNTSYNIGCNETTVTARVRNTQITVNNVITQQHNTATQVNNTNTITSRAPVTYTTACYNTGIKEYSVSNAQLTVYPNPNTGNFTISYNIEQNATLYIFDAQGKQVYSLPLSAEQKSIEVNNLNLANGIYMYKVLNSGNMLHNGKLIILK